MSFDRLCSLLDRFGPGCLTVRTPDGLLSRPFLPVTDRARREFAAIAEDDWLRSHGGREIAAQLAFSSDTGLRCLAIKGTMRRSTQPGDIASSWSTLAQHWFPDGPEQQGLVALRFAPASAELWDVRLRETLERWIDGGAV